MERLIRLIIGAPAVVVAATVLITFVSLVGVARLTFDDGMRTAFVSDTAAYRAFDRERRNFAFSDNDIAVHVFAADLGDSHVIDAAERFVLELGTIASVKGVVSVFSLRHRPDAEGNAAPLFRADRAEPAARRAAMAAAAAHPLNAGRILSRDLRHMIVLVRVADEGLSVLSGTIAAARAIAARSFRGTSAGFAITGVPVLRGEILSTIARDQTIVNAGGAIIGFLLCLLMFRSVALALVAGLPAVIALVWVLGFLGHSGIGISTITNALPVLILVLAFADSMHLTYEMRRRMAAGEDAKRAIEGAVRLAGPACVMTSLTTAFAFAALLLSQSELVRGLALAGLYSVTIALAAVLILTPVIFVQFARFARVRRAMSSPALPLLFPSGAWARVIAAILTYPGRIALVSAAAIVLATAVYMRIEPRYSFVEAVDRKAPAFRELIAVERLLAPLSSIDVIVPTAPSAAGKVGEAALERVGRVHAVLERAFGAQRVVSLWSVARWIQPGEPASAAGAISALMTRAQGAVDNTFLASDGAALKIRVLTGDIDSPAILARAAEIRRLAAAAVDDGLPAPRTAGLLVMVSDVATIMISDINVSFLAAVFASGLAIALWCRNAVVGMLALLPNILPIALVGAWLEISGHGLQFASGLALTIAFGIAVDDTIHALNRLRPHMRPRGAMTLGEIRRAYDEVSPVLAATTIILCFGLASTQASAIPTIAFFGALSIAVFALALLADLAMLPALLACIARDRAKAGPR